MRCVEWSAEYIEAHVIAMLLRSNGIDAIVFDEHFVRQNWFELLGYGGFRVMSSEHRLADARRIVSAYRSGALQLDDALAVEPDCPRCASHETEADPRPRRLVFLVYIVFGIIALVPALIRRLVVGRYRCRQCRNAWREPRTARFAEQQRNAEAAPQT